MSTNQNNLKILKKYFYNTETNLLFESMDLERNIKMYNTNTRKFSQ